MPVCEFAHRWLIRLTRWLKWGGSNGYGPSQRLRLSGLCEAAAGATAASAKQRAARGSSLFTGVIAERLTIGLDDATGNEDGPRIVTAELRCPGDLLEEQRRFYTDELGFAARDAEGGWAIAAGEAELGFAAAKTPAFYHYALLVPAGRFAAARDWAARRTA